MNTDGMNADRMGGDGMNAERTNADGTRGSGVSGAESGLRFHAILGSRNLDAAFEVAAGETVALLGSNGAGKSTVVQLIAGLLRPDRGRATLDGRVLFDVEYGTRGPAAGPDAGAGGGTDTRAGVGRHHAWLPPHARGTALLAQEPLLFPHLSVRENVAFGPRSAGATRAAARSIADDWLARAEVADLADRRPAALSGGQAQRVAVARALAAHPSLLLLDEPMTALDVAAVPAQRMLLHGVLRNRTVVLVTHDPLDALVLADRVVVLDRGRVVEHGPTREVFTRPSTEFTRALTFGLDLGA